MALRIPRMAARLLVTALAFAGCGPDGGTTDPTKLVVCADLDCADDQRACTETDGWQDAVCGGCLPGHDEQQGRCVRITSCDQSSDVCGEGTCQNTGETYTCNCDSGHAFDGNTCVQIVTCEDLTCEDDHRTCHESNGVQNAACGDCSDGYIDTDDGTCAVNHCAPTPEICSGVHQVCVNEIDTYRCECEAGYQDLGAGCELVIDKIALGGSHTCALAHGKLYCWGRNNEGQLGTGNTVSRGLPTRIGNGNTVWDDVVLGGTHTCALTSGKLYCWGDNEHGQLGTGDTIRRLTPELVGNGEVPWDNVASGTHHACALAQGELYCWGSNVNGQLGIGDNDDRHMPTRMEGDGIVWDDIQVAYDHSCAMAQGKLYCWGSNAQGQLGTGDNTPRSAPVRIGNDTTWDAFTTGNRHTCGITQGEAYCWGWNILSELGIGVSGNRNTPTRVATAITTWDDVQAGAFHTCALAQGTLYCWGNNGERQLGVPNPTSNSTRNAPVLVEYGDIQWDDVRLGDNHSCGTAQGKLYCWGWNLNGQLGVTGIDPNYGAPITPVVFP